MYNKNFHERKFVAVLDGVYETMPFIDGTLSWFTSLLKIFCISQRMCCFDKLLRVFADYV